MYTFIKQGAHTRKAILHIIKGIVFREYILKNFNLTYPNDKLLVNGGKKLNSRYIVCKQVLLL